MPRHKRPENDACDAMAWSYDSSKLPCTHQARWQIDGHNLCSTHSKIVALQLAIKRGDAKPAPIENRKIGSVEFIK